ncbi:MAG: hypothetical protein HKN58_03125 [Xanthomonadales bacterium]|nr:hypothetical protein [Xanthomonadales bacterium]
MFWISALLLAWLLARQWEQRPIDHPPGVLVAEPPAQVAINAPAGFLFEGFEITPRARFNLRARVLSAKRYHLGMESKLSPVDLALGWGAMSNTAVLERIDIRQSGRWYHTRYAYPAPLPDQEIIRHSSNMHMVPAHPDVAKALKRIREGDLVRIRGQLIDVDHGSGWNWRTSLRRDDTGNGACEIVWVESLWVE